MDPAACVERIKIAVQEQDWEEFDEAMSDLRTWVLKGGFLPVLTGPVFGGLRSRSDCILSVSNGTGTIVLSVCDGSCSPAEYTWKLRLYTVFGDLIAEYFFPAK